MIKLKDSNGENFTLLKGRARDTFWFALRKEIDAAIKATSHQGRQLDIYNSERGHFVIDVRASISKTGFLKLGCHRFDPKTSRIIIRWAAGK